MGENQPQNRWLTVLKTVKMILVRPSITSFKMTVMSDCAVSAWSPLTQPVRAIAPWLSVGGVSLWTAVYSTSPHQNKYFPFHQPGFFNSFLAASGQTPLLVTKWTMTMKVELFLLSNYLFGIIPRSVGQKWCSVSSLTQKVPNKDTFTCSKKETLFHQNSPQRWKILF